MFSIKAVLSAINLLLPFTFFPYASNGSPISRISSPLIDRLLSFLKFQFDPDSLIIDFPIASQPHMLASILRAQLGF